MSNRFEKLLEDANKVRKVHGDDTLSVEEVLKLPTLKGYKILGGENGLKNRCRHMTILETPTGINWLEGKEFLLTAGYAFCHDENYKKSMMIDAKNKGVSAIAIKDGRYFGEINQDLINQANEYNIPLILIPYEVIYTSTVSSFYDMLFYRKNEYILQLNSIYEKLMELSFENRDIDGIIHSLTNITDLRIMLCDQFFKIVFTNIVDVEINSSILSNRSIEEITMNASNFNEPRINLIIKNQYVSIYPIIGDDKNKNYIIIIGSNKMDRLSQRTIEYGVSIIAAKLERDKSTRISQTRFNKTLVEMMLNNKELPEEFYDNVCRELNWDDDNPYVGLAIKITEHKDETINANKNEIYKAINKILGKDNYLYIDKNNYIFIFLKVHNNHHIEGFIAKILEADEVTINKIILSIGISNIYRDLRYLKKLYEESYMSILFSDKDIVYYKSLDTIRLLYPLKEGNETLDYYSNTLKKLEIYDKENSTNLLETLEVFFRYNLKKTVVAKKLFIHVETLRYRLNRIEEITGYSLDDSEGIFALQMGLKLKRLIKL